MGMIKVMLLWLGIIFAFSVIAYFITEAWSNWDPEDDDKDNQSNSTEN